MPMRVEMQWQGRRQWTERGRRLAAEGLTRALEHTLGVSNAHVPLREGTLERSGKVVVNGLDGAISYDTVYAVRQLPARRAHLEAPARAHREVPRERRKQRAASHARADGGSAAPVAARVDWSHNRRDPGECANTPGAWPTV